MDQEDRFGVQRVINFDQEGGWRFVEEKSHYKVFSGLKDFYRVAADERKCTYFIFY